MYKPLDSECISSPILPIERWVVRAKKMVVLILSDFDKSVLFSCGWFKVTAGRTLNVRNFRTSGIVNW